ncbi:hypothetical protein KJ059_00555 [Myxococcota bacterium]|nr:hypothetical protein [Myxococcota bacterium]
MADGPREPEEPRNLRPVSDLRDRRGRFAKGSGGRPPGTRNRLRRTVNALLEASAPELVQRVLELARQGDVQALKLALDRIVPVPRDAPVALPSMPAIRSAADLPVAFGVVLQAVADGSLTPTEGERIASLLGSAGRMLELADIEARVRKLETTDFASLAKRARE